MDFNFFFNLYLKTNFCYFYSFFLLFFGFSFKFSFYLLTRKGYNLFLKKHDLKKSILYDFFIDFNFFYCLFNKMLTLKLMKIDFLKNIKVYKGFRFLNKLPVNGQNTRSNAKTSKKGII